MLSATQYSQKYLQSEIQEIEESSRYSVLPELNKFEKAIINKYSLDGYEGINEQLRKTKGKEIPEFGRLLNIVLGKLPDYRDVVYRGVTLTQRQIQRYRNALLNGTEITEYAFISSSTSRIIGKGFMGNCFFIIKSNRGKLIEEIAHYGKFNPPNEYEVLFKSNTKFSILDITTSPNAVTITMEEK